jgi:hypothetical protein
MKGIVVEINKNEAVILTDGGLFTKEKNKNYTVGQAIQIQESRKTYPKLVAGAASMAAAFAVCTIGAYAWFTPTDYVSMDVNPSIEYSLNTFDRILDVKGVNEDGEEILEGLDLKNMKIEEAVKETLDKLMADGYLNSDPNGGVVITTSNDDTGDAEQLAAELEQEVQAYLDDQDGIKAEVDAEAVAPERVDEAKELGVTPGKLNLVEKLQASTTGAVHIEEWLNKPVKEINKAIKENRKTEMEDKETVSKPDREDTETENRTDMDQKPGKKDKERPDKIDQNIQEDDISDNDKTNNNSDQKINKQNGNEQKTDQKTDKEVPDNKKPPKNDSRQGGGNSSGRDNDQND